MKDESVAAVAVALAMAMEERNPGFLESFARESERLFRIMCELLDEDYVRAHDGSLLVVGELLRRVKIAKLKGIFDDCDTYQG